MNYFHQRISPRLKGFDYAQPHYYYVTICTSQRRCLFGTPEKYNGFGRIAEMEMEKLPAHYEDVLVDQFVIMPNHVHAIFAIGCNGTASVNPTLSTVVGLYKSTVSKKIHEMDPGLVVWQKSFYEEIIRNKAHYLAVWNYIDGNPSKWMEDEYFSR